jgi:hypothetical protein
VAEEMVADEGYFSGEQLAEAEKAQYLVIVNLDTANRQEKAAGEYNTWQFTYDEANDCCIWRARAAKPEIPSNPARRPDR